MFGIFKRIKNHKINKDDLKESYEKVNAEEEKRKTNNLQVLQEKQNAALIWKQYTEKELESILPPENITIKNEENYDPYRMNHPKVWISIAIDENTSEKFEIFSYKHEESDRSMFKLNYFIIQMKRKK